MPEVGRGQGAADGGPATAIFLFSFDTRVLEGFFVATGPAGLNLEPEAWKASRKNKAKTPGSPFPAQLQVRLLPSSPVSAVAEDRFSTGPIKQEIVQGLIARLHGDRTELGPEAAPSTLIEP